MIVELSFKDRYRVMPIFNKGRRLHCVYLALLAKDEGKVFADDPDKPTVAMFIHPFFTVVGGDWHSPAARQMLKKAPLNEIIMSLDGSWDPLIKSMHGKRAISLPRTKFVERMPDLAKAKALADNPPEGYTVSPITPGNINKLLDTFKDTKQISGLFWNAETFPKQAFGFIALDKDENVVSVAIMGTPLHNKAFEIHTETHADHRQKGLATVVNAALVVEAGKRGLLPLWDAANENSVKLATRVGFTEEQRYEIFVTLSRGLYFLKRSGLAKLINRLKRK